MFEEGDWNDDVEARALTDAVFHTHRLHPSSVAPSAHSKKKRRKLLETLRALKAAGWPGGEPGSEAGGEGPVGGTATLSRKQWRNRRKNKLRNRNKFRLPGVCPSVGDSGGEVGHEDTGVTTVGGHEQLTLDREVDGRTGRARERKAMAEGSKGGERGGGDTLPSGVPGEGVEGPEEGVEGQGEGRTGLCSGRSAALRSRMQQRLQSARFRYINEQLYTSSSAEARCMFARDSDAFLLYHQGFNTQLQSWPQNPVQNIISYIKHRPRSAVVADFGCGDCKIASSVGNTVHSFDLAALNDLVTVCDMAKVPLADESVDIAVFCLSLMGTNLVDFLMEANRVLRVGGVLKIAEVASRFEDVRSFIGALGSLGFKLLSKDTDSRFFYLFEFGKTRRPREGKLPALQLKPCLYKRR